MKKTILIFVYCISMVFNMQSQEQVTSVQTLEMRLDQIGDVSGNILDFFSQDEINLMRDHLRDKDGFQQQKQYQGGLAYCGIHVYGTLGSFMIPGGDVTEVGTSSVGFAHAGAVDPNNPDTAYVFNNTDDLFSINLATGEPTLLANLVGDWLGAEFSPNTGVLYAVNANAELHTIDIDAGTTTLMGSTGLGILAGLAINDNDQAYTADLQDDNLYQIDLSTGVATLIGAIGFDANFGQGMFWDEGTNTIYMTAFNNILFDEEFREVNTSTGNTIFLSTMGIPGAPTQFPWASSPPAGIPEPDPALFNTWYLSAYSYDFGGTFYVEDISPSISPFLTMESDLTFSGQACNEYGGYFTYDEVTDRLVLEQFDLCLCGSCDNPPQSHVDFENDYFEYFIIDDNYNYILSEDDDQSYLRIFSQASTELFFQSTPLTFGIDDVELKKVTIYPNPVLDVLRISSENIAIDSIVVYSMQGQRMDASLSENNSVNVSSLSEGLYFIEVITSEGKSVQKFVKK